MRTKERRLIVAFYTTHDAMAFEDYCLSRGAAGRLIPLPREISAGCGLALRMLPEDYAAWMQVLETVGPAAQGVYDIMMF